MKLERGSVLLVNLDPATGHEQRGLRPCIAISDPLISADQRFPLIGVIPITGTEGQGILYPKLAPGKSGLTKTSYALIDHVRSIDKRRIRHVFGRLTAGEMRVVDEGLALFLGLRFPG